jgi:hypothetical protein
MNIYSRIFTASVWFALILFLSGNVHYHGTYDGIKYFLEVSDWGFALVPTLAKDFEIIYQDSVYPTFRNWKRMGT